MISWWIGHTIVFLFLTCLFLGFYTLLYATILGIRENYHRYAQKSKLQWTGAKRSPRKIGLWTIATLLITALISSWISLVWLFF